MVAQLVLPGALLVLAAQGVATVAPEVLTKKFAGEMVQAELPAVELKYPGEQSVALLAPTLLTNDPAGAAVHDTLAVPLLYVPAAQTVDTVAPPAAT
jgi:hypothetical protein